jgi:hypothetical protein
VAGARNLANAVRRAEEHMDTLNREVRKLTRELAREGRLTEQFDDAVQDRDEERIRRLMREAGISDEVSIDIVEISPNARIQVSFCLFGGCFSCTCEW